MGRPTAMAAAAFAFFMLGTLVLARADRLVPSQETEQDTVAGLPTPDTVAGLTAQEAITAFHADTRGPDQPIPFNHRFHSGELQIDCLYCHTGTDRSQTGVMPSLETCMGCHRIAGSGLEPVEELRGRWERGEPVQWEWVYKLPEFVQFNHAPHLRNGVQCEECHGPVEETDRIYQWAPLTMGWCLECHRGEPAETDVATDHTLTERYPPPPIPEGRERKGLYPVRISSEYGASRGPIDCLACHY